LKRYSATLTGALRSFTLMSVMLALCVSENYVDCAVWCRLDQQKLSSGRARVVMKPGCLFVYEIDCAVSLHGPRRKHVNKSLPILPFYGDLVVYAEAEVV
jgi:hypothetical protein